MNERTSNMKAKLFLLVAVTGLIGIGTARADCTKNQIAFPTSGSALRVPSGTCIAPISQAARLRWDNNGSGRLDLFDTDESGQLIWCAHDIQNPSACASGNSFCLQVNGNATIWTGSTCGTGTMVWQSGTVNKNIKGEVIKIVDGPDCGEMVAIVNMVDTVFPANVWFSNNCDTK
jgi:hypothetical protein